MDDAASDDPGWPWEIFLTIIPGVGRLIRRRLRRAPDPIITTRILFLAFNNSLILFAYVLLFLKVPNGPVVPWLPIVVVLAAGSVVGNRVLTEKPLDCSSSSALMGSYRTRLFATIAVSESVALFAFLFTFIGAPKWTYDVGGAFSLFQLWTVEPPTRAAFARIQERLDASGCTLSFYDAFRGRPPS